MPFYEIKLKAQYILLKGQVLSQDFKFVLFFCLLINKKIKFFKNDTVMYCWLFMYH